MIYWCSVFTRIVKYALLETSEFWTKSCDSSRTETATPLQLKLLIHIIPVELRKKFHQIRELSR